jgi:hypothetical protein
MAGLAGTQQGAREALAASFDTTGKFGELAAQAMMQAQELIAKTVMTYFTGGLGAASFLDSAPGMRSKRRHAREPHFPLRMATRKSISGSPSRRTTSPMKSRTEPRLG